MFSFGIQDAIDILLTAALLTYIYQLMRASRSGRIFTGILIFVVVWIIVSHIFEMRLMGRIMGQAVNLGGIALIVIFQDDIRSFFFRLGSGQRSSRLFRFFSQRKEVDMSNPNILPIVMACINMSRQKVGALIVLERSMSLKEVVQSGEVINATISQRLLENLFFKNSPLHDGAVVIAQKRIRSAGCILPVSHADNIPKHLGLRHRAALGISQQSDCLAIIVSEETGSISVAMDSKFHLRLTSDGLEKLLRENW